MFLRLANARQELDKGNFQCHPSAECCYRLLKAFFRELPEALVPEAKYKLVLAATHEALEVRLPSRER